MRSRSPWRSTSSGWRRVAAARDCRAGVRPEQGRRRREIAEISRRARGREHRGEYDEQSCKVCVRGRVREAAGGVSWLSVLLLVLVLQFGGKSEEKYDQDKEFTYKLGGRWLVATFRRQGHRGRATSSRGATTKCVRCFVQYVRSSSSEQPSVQRLLLSHQPFSSCSESEIHQARAR